MRAVYEFADVLYVAKTPKNITGMTANEGLTVWSARRALDAKNALPELGKPLGGHIPGILGIVLLVIAPPVPQPENLPLY